MKKLLLCLTAVALLAAGCSKKEDTGNGGVITLPNGSGSETSRTSYSTDFDGEAVQLALLLDTSNSMDGLIEQAKGNLWTIINYFAAMKKDGESIKLEIALFEYGNDSLNIKNSYIRKVLDLTADLDEISEKLFGLTTNGGSEFCGAVIDRSLSTLEWDKNPEVMRVIFIAGNEPFNQGYTDYKAVCRKAFKEKIYVNTIHCGDIAAGISGFWKHGAELGGGKFMVIDHNAAVADIATPYDDQLMKLNTELNDTYIPYGSSGRYKKEMQVTQDSNAVSMNEKVMTDRIVSKSSKQYNNSSWDLVDAADDESFDIAEVEEESLPEEYRGLSDKELEKKVAAEKQKRIELQKKIADIAAKRSEFIQKHNEETGVETLDSSIIKSINELSVEKGFIKK
jgi:hypothetical protein